MDRRHETWEETKKLQKSRGLDENHPLVLKVWQELEKEEEKEKQRIFL